MKIILLYYSIILIIKICYAFLLEIGQFNKEFETSKLDEPLRLDEGFLNSKDFLDVDKSSKFIF